MTIKGGWDRKKLVTFEYCEATDDRPLKKKERIGNRGQLNAAAIGFSSSFLFLLLRCDSAKLVKVGQDTLMLLKIYCRIIALLLVVMKLLLPTFVPTGLRLTEFLFDSFSQMRMNMLRQMVFTIESFATFRASVDLVGSVNDRVPLQMFDALESLVTHWARMRTLGHVRRAVPVEMFFAFEGGTTVVANERSLRTVHCKMCLDRFPVVEDRVTLWASKESRSIKGRCESRLKASASSARSRQARNRIPPLLLLLGLFCYLRLLLRGLNLW